MTAFTAELWYPQPPDLDDAGLLVALRAIAPAAEPQEGSLVVPHEQDGRPPLLTVVLAGSALGVDGKTRPDVSQTWDWVEAEAALADCRASVLVTEMLATDSTPAERLRALTRVTNAVIEQTRPAAVHWAHSQRVSNPARFAIDTLDGPVNIRMFAVADDDDALVMDSLGLHVFGLPDVQCHFRGRPPGEVATLLFTAASYLFEAGDVIADGNTISEPDGDQHYRCWRESALLPPHRPVIDIDLGEHAAGRRTRAD